MSVLGPLYPQRGGGRWLEPLRHWPSSALRMLAQEPAVVRVLVAGLRGSGPREVGACMLVGRQQWLGTIGGGRLEHEAQQAAQAMLAEHAPQGRVLRMTLGTDLGQCCGGVVELWLERYVAADVALLQQLAAAPAGVQLHSVLHANGSVERTLVGCAPRTDTCVAPSNTVRDAHPTPERAEHKDQNQPVGCAPRTMAHAQPSQTVRDAHPMVAPAVRVAARYAPYPIEEALPQGDPPLYLYGAGHVGQALVRVLAGLPFAVHWIDTRADLIPTDLPASVTPLATPFPLETLRQAPPSAWYIVMTHDHALDYALCKAILQRDDFAFAGLIGSHSKAARFRSRLARDGIAAAAIAKLHCPIGIAGIESKQAGAIAIAIAAQLLQVASAPLARPQAPIETCTAEGCATCPQQQRQP